MSAQLAAWALEQAHQRATGPTGLPVLVTKVSLFAAACKDVYVPVTLELRLHWSPVTGVADTIISDSNRCMLLTIIPAPQITSCSELTLFRQT
jgi:hypothetical protein